jgi:hypothetical protein
MVTAAFTIFRQIELLFNRILLAGGAGAPAQQGILDFCASHNILRCIAQGRPGQKGRFNQGKHEMTQTYEDFTKYGKEFADTGLKSFASLTKGAQAIATEAGEYTKKSFEAGSAAVEKLFAAKSIEKAIEIQTDYAKQSYESFVAEASKIGNLYAELAKEAYKPFESVVAKAK